MVGVGRVMDRGIAFDDLRYSPLGAVPVTNGAWLSARQLRSHADRLRRGRTAGLGQPGGGTDRAPDQPHGLGCQPRLLVLNAPRMAAPRPTGATSGFHVENSSDRNHALVMYTARPTAARQPPGLVRRGGRGRPRPGARRVSRRPPPDLFGADYRAADLQPGAVAIRPAARLPHGQCQTAACAEGCSAENLTLTRLTTPSACRSVAPWRRKGPAVLHREHFRRRRLPPAYAGGGAPCRRRRRRSAARRRAARGPDGVGVQAHDGFVARQGLQLVAHLQARCAGRSRPVFHRHADLAQLAAAGDDCR